MRIVRLLACALASAGIVQAASAQLVRIPGTLVALEAPQGFKVARTFRGLENVRGGSSITVEELPADSYPELNAAFSSPKSASTRFADQGVRITRIEPLALDSGPVPLAIGEQAFNGREFTKYIALMGGPHAGTHTVLISFNLSSATPLRQSDVEAVLRSVAIARLPTLEEKLSQVPFTFRAAPPFHVVDAMPGSAVILSTAERVDPAGKKPMIVIGKVATAASPAEVAQTNERELRTVPGFKDAPIGEQKVTQFAGGQGHFISAAADGKTVLQFLRVLPGGSYIRFLASGETGAIEEVREAINETAASVELPE
jgi:hypothetical protein